MAAKDSDETVAIFSPKRPRIDDSDAVLLQHRNCNKVVNSLEKTSDPLMETPVVPYFNNRLSCSDIGNANPQVHHRYNDDDNEEKEKNQIINKSKNNNNNKKEDPKQQSMEEEDGRYSDVRNHTNDGDGDEELEEGRRRQGAAKNDKNTEQMLLTAADVSDEKEMDNKILSCPHDLDIDNQDDDNLDNVSEISDLAALDEDAWRPVSGPLNWVQRQMSLGRDPRMLFKELISPDTFIPPDLDEMTLWGLLANFITEPPKRKKLNHINSIDDVVHLLKTSKKIMVLTGAGVSVSCGIPDFRSRDGIYARLAVDFPDLPDPQAMFDINYFRNDPRPFFKFAKEIYPGQFKPSKCHKFIKLIEDHSRLLHNYTQNIDTLEQQAGIQKVIQCHGSFATATCMNCSFKLNAQAIRDDIFQQVIPKCPKCPPDCATAIMKPDIVFFGENLPELFHYQMAEDKEQCDLLIVIGSSMKVRPVALIPNYIPAHVPQILINREPLNHMTFDVELLGDGDIIVNDLCKRLGDGWREAFCDSGPVSVQITKDQLEISPSPSKFSEKSQNPSSENSIQNKMENSKGFSVKDVTENDAKLSENGQINSSLCKKNAENGSCSEVKTPNNSESSQTCERIKENCKMEENVENVDNLKSLWKKNKHRKQSLARHLKDNQVLFLPPCQYAYPGAEICSEDEEGEEEEEEDFLEESESHNSESSSSWESFSDEEDKKLSENRMCNSVMLYPSNISSVDLYPPAAVACGAADASSSIMSTDLKSSSGTATLKSSSIITKLQTCKADGQLSSNDPLLQELCNPELQNAEKDASKTFSSCVTLHEGQQNGYVGKTGDTNSSAAAFNLHQHSHEMSIGATKNQHIRTENLVNSFLSTQATTKKHTEMDTVSSTLTLTDGKH